MSIHSPMEIRCPNCRHTQTVTLWRSLGSVLAGCLLALTTAGCGKEGARSGEDGRSNPPKDEKLAPLRPPRPSVPPFDPAEATPQPCRLLFENLSREIVEVHNVTVVQADASPAPKYGVWRFRPGDRSLLIGNDGEPLHGRQVHYTLQTPDGVDSNLTTRTTRPLVTDGSNISQVAGPQDGTAPMTGRPVTDGSFILMTVDDELLGEARKNEMPRLRSKAELTYRYWNAVHGINLEETFDAVQTVGFLEISTATGVIRTMANRIDDLSTTGVDTDAVAVAKTYAALLREVVKVMNGRGGAKAVVVLGELYNQKVDTFGKMLDENQTIAGKTEDFHQFLRSRRKALEGRYEMKLPPLIPPVTVGLAPFQFSKGYYVNLMNGSGEDIKNVSVRYRDAVGKARVQFASNRMTFQPGSIDFTRVDPSDIKWRIDSGEWITVLYDDGAYSYPTTKLIKR